MAILTNFHPLSMNKCIFSAFDQNDRINIAVVSGTVEQWVQRRKMLNKMTECIFNALAFLFVLLFTVLIFHIGL